MSSHYQICMNFLQQSPTGKKGFNVWYEGDTIYSYGRHFPMAHITESGIVLIRCDHPSVSTAKHLGHMRAACRYLNRTYYEVPFVVPPLGREWSDIHEANLAYFAGEAADRRDRASRARKYRETYLNAATACDALAASYKAHFNC